MDVYVGVANLPFSYHLIAGLAIRLGLIVYGDYQDNNYEVAYTDVDYKVFTDAARHVVAGNSPYNRHTYRYSPIIAYLLIPNIIIGRNFGKILFALFDIFVAISSKTLVESQLKSKEASRIAKYCSFFWIYNPFGIVISTRGNADSVPCFFIIMSIYFLQTNEMAGLLNYALSGILLGISIHLRMYPIVFSFPMYLSLGKYKITRSTGIKESICALVPNRQQIILTTSCVATLFLITYGMYLKYGYEFLFETYIYHLFRQDTRHNFSVLFYHSYLNMTHLTFDLVKTITQFFELALLILISLTFGCEPKSLPFALFCQAVILVTFNSVVTSQYFIWFLSLLPLVVHNFMMKPLIGFMLVFIWFSTQFVWLLYAYALEFHGMDVFMLIWIKGVVFFGANIFVLIHLIKTYMPGYGFGLNGLVFTGVKAKQN